MARFDASESAESFVDALIGLRSYRERKEALLKRGGAVGLELSGALTRRAHALIRHDPRKAEELNRLAIHVSTVLDDGPSRLEAMRGWAEACIVRGRYPTALRILDRALGDSETKRESWAYLQLLRMQPLIHLERYDDAATAGRAILATFGRLQDTRGQVRTHMALADLAFRRDRPRDALGHYHAVDVLLPDPVPRVRAALAINRANALEACNRFRAARRHFDLARRLYEEEACEHGIAQANYNAAYGEALRGHYEDALRIYAASEETFERLDDERHQAHIALDRAEIYIQLNMPEDARTCADRAEALFDRLQMVKEKAQAAQLSGRAAELRGDADGADAAYERAGALFAELRLSERQAGCLVMRAALALARCYAGEAETLVNAADALLPCEPSLLSQVSIELMRGRLDLAVGNWGSAVKRLTILRERCRRIHMPWIHVEVNRLLGQAHVGCGSREEALAAYKDAVEGLERYRGGVPPDEFMSAFLAGKADVYAEVVDLLVRMGEPRGAFEFTERGKSRALTDLLARRQKGPGAGPHDARIHALRDRLATVYARLAGQSGANIRSATARGEAHRTAANLEAEIARLLRDRRVATPEAASLEAVQVPKLEAIQKDLERNTALVEYMVTETSLLIFVVKRRSIHVSRVDVGVRQIRHWMRRFRFHLAKFDRAFPSDDDLVRAATHANLRNLAHALIEPVAEHLDVQRLVIVPHRLLHHLPFHALPHGSGWLIDDYEVVYAPSATVYGFCRRKAPMTTGYPTVLALPDDKTPQIEREAYRVAAVLGTDQVFLGEEATADRLNRAVRDAPVVHLATHGMFRREQPMLSAIRLADRWLNLYDIYELDVRSRLVVLSTCESGTAEVTDGDEVLGLTRGFLYAGAPALMASQWRVDDETTTAFMQDFYCNLDNGPNAAAALRQTMIEMRARHPHPYYWAPFFLTGRPLPRHATKLGYMENPDDVTTLEVTHDEA